MSVPARWTTAGSIWCRPFRVGLLLGLALALTPGVARAHKVSVFAAVEGDSVLAEAYFADGSPCAGAAVEVFDVTGKAVAAAETDSRGQVAFPRLRDDGLRLVVNAGLGHRDEFTLTAEDLSGPAGRADPSTGAGATGSRSAVGIAAAGTAGGGAGADSLLARRLEDSLERKLAPLEAAVRRLEKSQQRAGIKDAVTGVGFIFGLAGLWALLINRRRRAS